MQNNQREHHQTRETDSHEEALETNRGLLETDAVMPQLIWDDNDDEVEGQKVLGFMDLNRLPS